MFATAEEAQETSQCLTILMAEVCEERLRCGFQRFPARRVRRASPVGHLDTCPPTVVGVGYTPQDALGFQLVHQLRDVGLDATQLFRQQLQWDRLPRLHESVDCPPLHERQPGSSQRIIQTRFRHTPTPDQQGQEADGSFGRTLAIIIHIYIVHT